MNGCGNQIVKKTTENLYFACTYKNEDVPVSVDNIFIRSSLKKISDNSIINGVVVKTSNVGEFTIDFGFSPTPALYICDILFITGTIVVASESFTVSVIDGITPYVAEEQ